MGVLSSAGGPLVSACYPRKAAALALDPPKHLSTWLLCLCVMILYGFIFWVECER